MLQKVFIIAILLFLLQSCSQSTRLRSDPPNEGHGLKLDHKNDLKLATNASNPHFAQEKDTYLDVQMGYSPIKHIGIQAGHYFFRSAQSSQLKSEFEMNNISIGVYHNFDFSVKDSEKKRDLSSILLEVYGDFSSGSNTNKFKPLSTPQRIHNSNYEFQKQFIRSNCHFQFKEKLAISFGANIGQINYLEGTYNIGNGGSNLLTHFRKISDEPKRNFKEYVIRCTYQLKSLHLQSGFSTEKLSDFNDSQHFRLFYFGFTLDLDGMHRAIQKMTFE